jgi:hypothetical protein
MIEMEASVLEDGGLLNQITIVYLGQILPLRLIEGMGREGAAWVKVVNLGGDLITMHMFAAAVKVIQSQVHRLMTRLSTQKARLNVFV